MTIQHGAEQLWRTQKGAHGDEQTGACPAAERWQMVHHAGTRCVGWPRSASVLLRTDGHSPAEQSSLGDESVEKAHLVDVAPLSKAEP